MYNSKKKKWQSCGIANLKWSVVTLTNVLFLVDSFSRHAEGFAITKEEKTARKAVCSQDSRWLYTELGMSPYPFIRPRYMVYTARKHGSFLNFRGSKEIYYYGGP